MYIRKIAPKKDSEAIQPVEIEYVKTLVDVGDLISLDDKEANKDKDMPAVYKKPKGVVIAKYEHFMEVQTKNWRFCINWVDLLKQGAKVKINGRLFVR